MLVFTDVVFDFELGINLSVVILHSIEYMTFVQLMFFLWWLVSITLHHYVLFNGCHSLYMLYIHHRLKLVKTHLVVLL